MPRPLPRPVRQWTGDVPFLVFLVTVPLCLVRSVDVPSVGIGSLDVTVADVFLAITAVLAAARLRAERRLPSPWLLGAAAAFLSLLLASSLPNGADAVSGAAKIATFAALTLGAAAFLVSEARLRAFLTMVVLWATAAAAWAVVGFLTSDRGRQASFMGEHDMAAVGR
jgi:hypothetical protein